ncbi:MAG: hypothetical protein ACLP0L_07555, partial [Solirubrobacteraceae bacterium]
RAETVLGQHRGMQAHVDVQKAAELLRDEREYLVDRCLSSNQLGHATKCRLLRGEALQLTEFPFPVCGG